MKTKFQGKADIYDQYRCQYAKQCVLDLVTNIGQDTVIADIGAGTGIMTEQLLQTGGSKVIAVEPEEDMREIAVAKLSHYQERFVPMEGTAEKSDITDHSIDLIVVAQAFHWFDKVKFKKECQRIIKEGAHIALVWNSYVMEKEISVEMEKLAVAYGKIDAKLNLPYVEHTIQGFYQQGTYDKTIYANNMVMDIDAFIGYHLSKSYAPRENDKNYDAYLSDLRALFKWYQKDGKVIIYQNTICYDGVI